MRTIFFLLLTLGIAACTPQHRIAYRDSKQFKADAYAACQKKEQTRHYRVLAYDTDSAVVECLSDYED
jgi:hypothetical protein